MSEGGGRWWWFAVIALGVFMAVCLPPAVFGAVVFLRLMRKGGKK